MSISHSLEEFRLVVKLMCIFHALQTLLPLRRTKQGDVLPKLQGAAAQGEQSGVAGPQRIPGAEGGAGHGPRGALPANLRDHVPVDLPDPDVVVFVEDDGR